MKRDDEYTTEELVELEVFTVKETKEYVKEKIGIGDSLFKECIRPLLTFYPMLLNYKRKRHSHLVIPKKEVDKVIARVKKRLLKEYQVDIR